LEKRAINGNILSSSTIGLMLNKIDSRVPVIVKQWKICESETGSDRSEA